LNKIDSDGCEYACTESNGGKEICDGEDNNCNGTKDEGFDLSTDVSNCGSCGNVCTLGHATPECKTVSGFPTCSVKSCESGYSDVDKLNPNGCEYTCPVNPPVAEICNAEDDNCDGQINEGNPGGGQDCDTNCPNGVCQGECTSGTTVCVGTGLVCVPGIQPSLEVCDGKDNDCDGEVDNGFNTKTDPNNCGACGTVCSMDHAVGGCVTGACQVAACQPGYFNNDNDPANGCEYKCPVTSPTVETCNGIDDDCNGVVDDAAAIAAQKPATSGCYPKPGTPCAGADFVCTGTNGWRCNYGAGVETDAKGKLIVAETLCDGLDGNCNGQVDETFTDLNTECDNGKMGACRDYGKRVCTQNHAATVCDLTVKPDPISATPTTEICNGIDDDCDGSVDEDIADDMVSLTISGHSFKIDRYEASRPDATNTSIGLNETRRCVKANVLPWTQATNAEAAAACAATGARLCTAAELAAACAGTAENIYPYGAVYQPQTCNGLDNDGVAGGADDNVLLPTGAMQQCKSADTIYDLSGNAAEWSSTITDATLKIYEAQGGSYETPALGLTCGFVMSRFASNAVLPELGFRCCHN